MATEDGPFSANSPRGPIQPQRRDGDHGSNMGVADRRAVGATAVSDLIEAQIIPRLMRVRRGDEVPVARAAAPEVSPGDAARFAAMPLTREADELMLEVEKLLDRGVSPESIFVDLLAPSARRLGQLWEADKCDFFEVSMGLWRLQEVMREIAQQSPTITAPLVNPPSALFTPIPGEQHSFGTLMIEEVFARAGWRSEVLLEPRKRELLQVVAEYPFDLVGLTVSCDCPSASLSDLISSIRSVSKTPTTRILIGGRAVQADPDLVSASGADGTAADAKSALVLAERLVAESRLLDSPI